MRRSIVVACVLVLVVAACGGGSEPTGPNGSGDGSNDIAEVATTQAEVDTETTLAGTVGRGCDVTAICEVEVASTEFPLPDVVPTELTIEGSTAFVTTDSGELLEVDLTSGTIGTTFTFESSALDAAVDGADLWVLTAAGPVRIDRGSGEIGTVMGLPSSFAYHLTAGDGAVWVTTNGTGETIRFDPSTGTAVATITDNPQVVGGDPPRLVDAFGSVWVIDMLAGRLIRIDPATNAISSTFDALGYDEEDLGGGSTQVNARGPLSLTTTDDAVWVISDLVNPGQPFVSGVAGVFRIDPGSETVEKVLDLIADPDQTSLAVGSDAVWYIDSDSQTLIRADLETGIQARIRFGLRSARAVVIADGVVWVAVEVLGDPSALIGIEEAAAASAVSG